MRGREHTFRRETAARFYRLFCPDRVSEIEFIDFDYPVRDVAIEKGAVLWGFRDPRISPLHPRTSFFCFPGTPIAILGVSSSAALKTNPGVRTKAVHVYEVAKRIPHALESVCADGIDSWSLFGIDRPVNGGGWQYKIPEAYRYLRYTSAFPPVSG